MLASTQGSMLSAFWVPSSAKFRAKIKKRGPRELR